MDLTTFGLFLLTSAALGAAPGPSTLLVLSHALGPDPRRPASLIAGAFCGNVVLVLTTVLGLSAVILASQTASAIADTLGARILPGLPDLVLNDAEATLQVRMAPRDRPAASLYIESELFDRQGEFRALHVFVPEVPKRETPAD